MTQPDQLFPDGTANKGSFAAFAAKTQEQWQEEQRGKTAASLNNAKAGFGKIGSDIRTILSSIIRGWSGEGDSDWDFSDLFDTSASQKREQTQIAAGLAQLQADVAANNNSGKTLQVAVEDHGVVVPSVLSVFYDSGSGAIYNDGNTLQMSNNDGLEALKYHADSLLTDYFEVSLIVPKQSGRTFGSYVNRALFFIGRADATFDNYVVARLNGNKLRIGAVIDGVSTLESPTWFGEGLSGLGDTEVTITPGVYMTFVGGTLAGSRVFQFKVNNQVKATFADASAVSFVGADYRSVGFGIRNDNDSINQSATVSHFMANDNAPAEVVGTYARITRTSTSGVGVSSGVNVLPSNFFDLPAEVSEDMVYSLTDGSFTVPESAPYLVKFRSAISSSFPNHLQFLLFIDTVAGPYGGPDYMFGSNVVGGTIIPNAVEATWEVYLYAGDTIQVGYDASGLATPVFVGEATGFKTHLSIMRGR